VRDAPNLVLERALQLTIAALILFTVLSQGSLLSWIDTARKLRWLTLFAFAGLAIAYAVSRAGWRRLGFVQAGGAVLIGLALVSTAWSAFPRLTFERTAALGVLFAGCGALAAGVDGPEAARRFVDAIVAGAGAVAAGGLLVLVFDHDRAVQPATSALPARYQGLGGGPNTAMMALAVAMPLAVYVVLEARRPATRALAAAVVALLVGSIVASGSRGALVGGFAGLLAFALLAPSVRRVRALAAAAVVALLVVAALITRIPQPSASAPPLPSALPTPPVVFHGPRKAVDEPAPRLQDDVGRPPYGVAETTKKPRTLFGSSGRAQAWDGALHLGAQRPAAGFGFGTEDRVFFDRYADFNSNVPENSYIGLFLQLGIVGVVAFIGFLLALLVRGAVAVRDRELPGRRLIAACAAGLVAGLVLAAFQSYLYAVGNNATAAVWLCAFLLGALVPWPLRSRTLAVAGGIALVVFAGIAAVGVLERGHRGRDQSAAMRAVVAEIGPLDAPELDSYRYFSAAVQCLLYRRGGDPFALELCVDAEGRVVETIDRRTAPKPRIHSLRDDPTRSSVRVDRAEVTRLLRSFGIPANILPT
jgi:O-antigen ligase/polysaccharide polymerase Wzy-like membrane protein